LGRARGVRRNSWSLNLRENTGFPEASNRSFECIPNNSCNISADAESEAIGAIMREQRQSAEQYRSSIAVAAFYTTSALVATLGMAILLTSATIAYTLAQSFQ
jgi:hypothetical protein